MLLVPLSVYKEHTKLYAVSNFPNASCTNEAGDSFNLQRKKFITIYQSGWNILMYSRCTTNRVWVIVSTVPKQDPSLSIVGWLCLISIHCLSSPPPLHPLVFHPPSGFFSPSALFQLKVDTYWIYTEVQKAAVSFFNIKSFLLRFHSFICHIFYVQSIFTGEERRGNCDSGICVLKDNICTFSSRFGSFPM